MRGTAGNAAAPAARCMNARRGNFMMLPPQLRRDVDLPSNWTPCGNRLHPPCKEVEGANASSWHIASFRCAAEFGRYRELADSDNPSPGILYGSTSWLLHALFGKSLVERTKIDHD